jgi:hypothetical protein
LGAVVSANATPRAEALTRLRAAAHEAATIITSLDASQWDTKGVHHVRGELTVGTLIRTLVVEHAEDHCRQALASAGISTGE